MWKWIENNCVGYTAMFVYGVLTATAIFTIVYFFG